MELSLDDLKRKEKSSEEKSSGPLKQHLFIESKVVPLKTVEADARENLDLILEHEYIERAVENFKSAALAKIKHCPEYKVLCVLQREYAVVDSSVVDFVGSDDATNTIILFLKLGKFVCCGHFDNSEGIIGTKDCGVVKMAKELEEACSDDSMMDQDIRLTAWIVGGFIDERNYSASITGMILAALNNLQRAVDVELVCTEKHNDKMVEEDHFPVVLGACYSSEKKTVIACHFTHLGPGIGLRSTLSCSGKELMYPCYDWKTDQIKIMFEYAEFELAEKFLACPDEFLRENLATSSKQEPERFIATLRAGLTFLKDNPDDKKTFKDGPVVFERSQIGAWLLKKQVK